MHQGTLLCAVNSSKQPVVAKPQLLERGDSQGWQVSHKHKLLTAGWWYDLSAVRALPLVPQGQAQAAAAEVVSCMHTPARPSTSVDVQHSI